jgi:rsbT co-antagonist protein RsbR
MITENNSELLAEVERLRRRVGELERVEEARDRLQTALQTSHEYVGLFVDYLPAAVAICDRGMRYLVVSKRWVSDYKLDGQELLGRCHYDVFPDLPEAWKEIHRRCLAGGTDIADEEKFPRADGSVEWLRWQVFPWRRQDGEVGGIMMYTEVITRRKNMELQLEAQADMLRRLSTPIIPVSDDVLVMPFIGTLNRERTQQILEQLLASIVEKRARMAIIDMTGVPIVDSESVGALIRIGQAVRLLGADLVLTGIRPEVAQALVALQTDISSVVTQRDLQSGIAFAMRSKVAGDGRAQGRAERR